MKYSHPGSHYPPEQFQLYIDAWKRVPAARAFDYDAQNSAEFARLDEHIPLDMIL